MHPYLIHELTRKKPETPTRFVVISGPEWRRIIWSIILADSQSQSKGAIPRYRRMFQSVLRYTEGKPFLGLTKTASSPCRNSRRRFIRMQSARIRAIVDLQGVKPDCSGLSNISSWDRIPISSSRVSTLHGSLFTYTKMTLGRGSFPTRDVMMWRHQSYLM